MRHRASQVHTKKAPIRPRTDGPIIVISSPLQHLKQVFALSFRHYAAPWHAYLYFSLPKYMTATVHVRPQRPVTANGAVTSTPPPPISSLRYHSFGLDNFVPLTYSLSRLSLDDGRANESQALYNALYFIFLGLVIVCLSKQACTCNGTSPLPPSLCKTAHVLHTRMPRCLYDGSCATRHLISILHSYH